MLLLFLLFQHIHFRRAVTPPSTSAEVYQNPFPSLQSRSFFHRRLHHVYRLCKSLLNYPHNQLNLLGVHVELTVDEFLLDDSIVIDRYISGLNDDQFRLAQTIVQGDEHESFGSIGDQPITRKDIRTLRGLTWLNDEVIFFFIRQCHSYFFFQGC